MYHNIPQERLIEIFGHGRPNDREITAYKDMLWRQSVHYRRDIKRTILSHKIHLFLDDIGFYHIVDYQVRERQIRFAKEDILAHALLAGFEEFVVVDPEAFSSWPQI
jgi:hypothetical protein